MVHFPGLARTRLCIQRAVVRFYRTGFPHSEIPGSKPACGSPGLIAACHVLHRLLAPRHPPHALSSLTIKLTQHVVSRAHPVDVRNARTMRRWISSPFLPPQKTGGFCSSRTCGLRGAIPCGSTTRNYQPYSVVKELLLRARRSPRLGRGHKTKNPASSAGPIRHPDRRIRAMLDSFLSGIRNRPHFVPARGFGMRDAGSIAPDLPTSRRAIREYSRFCGGVKRAFSPSVCPTVQNPRVVDFRREGSWRASVANYAHRGRHCLVFAALSGKLKFPFHQIILCGQVFPSRRRLELGHPDARFVDTRKCEFAFFLHLFLVYRWCANAGGRDGAIELVALH